MAWLVANTKTVVPVTAYAGGVGSLGRLTMSAGFGRNHEGCCMVWYGMVEVCEGAPVAVSGWVLTDRHDLRPCAASSLHRETISVSNIIGGTGTLGIA